MIRDDLSNAEYHAHAAIGKSGLDAINRSPAHYWAKYLDPHREIEAPTPAMEFGTAVHCAVLEPARFEIEYVSAPKVDKRTKAGKEAIAAFEAENPGRSIISGADFDACRRISDAVRKHAGAGVLLESGKAEQSVFWDALWVTDATPVQAKCRPDWLVDGNSFILDVKTTEDARPEAFARSIWSYRYHVQAAWYLDGVAAATGKYPSAFVFLAIEKSSPYAIAAYMADEKMLEIGRNEYQRNLLTYIACKRDDYWPAYPEEILPIQLPAWAAKSITMEQL